ncbi:MAG: SWIM zinc finger family protein [Desulfobacterales bacterium]
MRIIPGDMNKGEHLVECLGKQYVVTLHDPVSETGHCSCPDFQTSRLSTCKHLMAVCRFSKTGKDFKNRGGHRAVSVCGYFLDAAAGRPRAGFANTWTRSRKN